MSLRFSKMHGIGNDFVIVDCRSAPLALGAAQIAGLADRHRGVGFDQLLTIEPATRSDCVWRYRIYNQDGSLAGQCGNGARCVVRWLQRAGLLPPGSARLQSPAGVVTVELCDDGRVCIEMGAPQFAPALIPLLNATEADRYRRDIAGRSIEFGAVSMGNPHVVIEVDALDRAPVVELGLALQHAADFPERCNVGFVQILSRDHLRLRVWERGVGETLACGSGACAAVAVLQRRRQVDDAVRVSLPGGDLAITRLEDGALQMCGPAEFVFEGEWQA